jgi:hypothetical protein
MAMSSSAITTTPTAIPPCASVERPLLPLELASEVPEVGLVEVFMGPLPVGVEDGDEDAVTTIELFRESHMKLP